MFPIQISLQISHRHRSWVISRQIEIPWVISVIFCLVVEAAGVAVKNYRVIYLNTRTPVVFKKLRKMRKQNNFLTRPSAWLELARDNQNNIT